MGSTPRRTHTFSNAFQSARLQVSLATSRTITTTTWPTLDGRDQFREPAAG